MRHHVSLYTTITGSDIIMYTVCAIIHVAGYDIAMYTVCTIIAGYDITMYTIMAGYDITMYTTHKGLYNINRGEGGGQLI